MPRYDKWFDAYAEDWGKANGFKVRVDHVNIAELPAALTASIEAGEGRSIIEMAFPPTAFIEGLHPLNDVNAAAAAAHGQLVRVQDAVAIDVISREPARRRR